MTEMEERVARALDPFAWKPENAAKPFIRERKVRAFRDAQTAIAAIEKDLCDECRARIHSQ